MSVYSDLTPFAAAQVVNVVLAGRNLDHEIKPQMMYNYAKKGIISSNYASRSAGEKIFFSGESFKTWLDSYVRKVESGNTGSRVDYNKLAQQYS
jgi:hypothetical protein